MTNTTLDIQSETKWNAPLRLLVLACSIAVLTGSFARRPLAAAELSEKSLDSIPTLKSDFATQLGLLKKELEQAKDVRKRIELLCLLGGTLDAKEFQNVDLKKLVHHTMKVMEPSYAPSFASVVAHYPSLHAALLEKASSTFEKDAIRLQFVRNVADNASAKRIYSKIELTKYRRYALESLFRRATSLDEKLAHLKELFALDIIDGGCLHSPVFELRPYATTSADAICDFVVKTIPARNVPRILSHFAFTATEENHPTVTRKYLEFAWDAVTSLPTPANAASSLLKHDLGKLDRDTWVSRFDRYVLPELRAATTGIGPLSLLARFDMDLVIDRTRQSCVHPSRNFVSVFPSVIERAFSVSPDAVLEWLERDDVNLRLEPAEIIGTEDQREFRDKCLHEIAEYLSVYAELGDSKYRPQLHRLCRLALQIENKQRRLVTLANLAAELNQLDVPVPRDVIDAVRKLLSEQENATPIDLAEVQNETIFLLCEMDKQKSVLDDLVKRATNASDEERRILLDIAIRLVSKSRLSKLDKRLFYQQFTDIARRNGDHRMRAQIAGEAVAIDPQWALRVIWETLPEDRGRSGKPPGNIGWVPSPSDAQDAIAWLTSRLGNGPESSGTMRQLLEALWAFLPEAPNEDRDGIREALCSSLIQQEDFGRSLWLIEQMQDPEIRTRARLDWILSHIRHPTSL
jgi:hypothetical protein